METTITHLINRLRELGYRLNSLINQSHHTKNKKDKQGIDILISSTHRRIKDIFHKIDTKFNESFILEVKYEIISSEGTTPIHRFIPNVTEKEFREYANLAGYTGNFYIHILAIREIRDLIKIIPL